MIDMRASMFGTVQPSPIYGAGNAQGPKAFLYGVCSLTIMSLLNHSLVVLQRRSAALARQTALPLRERSYGFGTTLVAARLQEAELLISGYTRPLSNDPAGDLSRRLDGWQFHR